MENNLPKGWANAKLKDLCDMLYGKGLLTKHLTEEGYPVYGANGVIGKYPSYIYEEPQVIISCRGAASGVIHKTVPFSFVTSNSIVLKLNSNEIDLDYFQKSIMSVDRSKIVTGSAQPQITIENLNDLEFPIAPLAEQHRIVAKLDAVMQKVESNKLRLEKIPKILKRFRQSVLAAAVSGRLTEIEDEIEKIPLGELISDLKYGTSQKSEKSNSGVPILRIPNIGLDGKITLDDLKFAELPKIEFDKLKLEKGDILLIRSNGSVSLLGRAAIVSNDQIGFAYAGYLIRLRCNIEKLLPEFLIHVLASYDIRMQIELPSRSSSGVNNINSYEVKALEIPSFTLEAQKEIVRRIDQLFAFADKLEYRYKKAAGMLDKLPQSILAKAFRGELVPQDSNDEPASVLLEKIKVEKGGMKINKKKAV